MRFAEAEKKNFMQRLMRFEAEVAALRGAPSDTEKSVLVDQVVSSVRRIEYVRIIGRRSVDQRRASPNSVMFDPIKGAIYFSRLGNQNEAAWLTFFGTNFGKHSSDGWKLAANVYGSFGEGPVWTFEKFSQDSAEFGRMLQRNRSALADRYLSGRYSNHRQYVSKKPEIIERAILSFFELMCRFGGFSGLVRSVHETRGQHAGEAFDGMYQIADDIKGFGRLGKFDFLTMLGKLELAPIEPATTYLKGATGPLRGARLLFDGSRESASSVAEIQRLADSLDDYLKVGKQAIEDSLCNWQKNPLRYEYFRG